jgi:hypothetical protein
MTLILTRIGIDGVVMAADSAITESYGGQTRILEGASKLFVHEPSSSCIGIWGGGVIPHPGPIDPPKSPIALQFLINEFVQTAASITSGDELATRLGEWLSENFVADNAFIGLEVATVRPRVDVHLPAVYRLTNAPEPDQLPSRFFRKRTIRGPAEYDDDVDQTIIPAGDSNAKFWVEEFHAAARRAAGRSGREPLPNHVVGLSSWLPSLVRAVSDAYRTLDIGQSISGQVSCVTLRSTDGEAKSVPIR